MDYCTIALAILAGILLFYKGYRNATYFKRIGIPYVTPYPFIGNMGAALLRLKNIADVTKDIYNSHREARYMGFFDVMTPSILIRDPELIKQIAVKNFEHFLNHRGFVDEVSDPLFAKNLLSLRDERWRDVRALLSPAFTSSKMKGMFHLMFDCAKDFTEYLSKLPPEKRDIDIKDSFTRYTNDVIATCAFGISVDSMKNPNNDFYVLGKEATNFTGIQSLKFFFIRLAPRLSRLLGIKFISTKVDNFFTDVVATTIRTRDEQNIHRPDMIQLMMDSRGKREAGRELSIGDMTSQAFIFFFGGFESTSTTMCFVAHEIAANPDVHKKLQAEINQVLEENNGKVNYEIVNNLEYLDAVVSETLRMYPIVILLDRLCSKPFELPPAVPGAKPLVVEKDVNVLFPVYGLHHDPEYFENPSKFDPERFLGENKKNINHDVYMPFGMGPRICIGNRFALLEIKVLLFHLLARCNLKPCSKTTLPMKLTKKAIVMMPENGFWLRVEPRTDVPRVEMVNGSALHNHKSE